MLQHNNNGKHKKVIANDDMLFSVFLQLQQKHCLFKRIPLLIFFCFYDFDIDIKAFLCIMSSSDKSAIFMKFFWYWDLVLMIVCLPFVYLIRFFWKVIRDYRCKPVFSSGPYKNLPMKAFVQTSFNYSPALFQSHLKKFVNVLNFN